MALAIGIDMIEISDTRASLALHGRRYVRRVFTHGEIVDSRDGTDARWLATCFAAKEATLKAIGATSEPIDLRSVEVRAGTSGQPSVCLSGTCAEIAERAGIVRISLSVAATRELATAIAIAQTDHNDRK